MGDEIMTNICVLRDGGFSRMYPDEILCDSSGTPVCKNNTIGDKVVPIIFDGKHYTPLVPEDTLCYLDGIPLCKSSKSRDSVKRTVLLLDGYFGGKPLPSNDKFGTNICCCDIDISKPPLVTVMVGIMIDIDDILTSTNFVSNCECDKVWNKDFRFCPICAEPFVEVIRYRDNVDINKEEAFGLHLHKITDKQFPDKFILCHIINESSSTHNFLKKSFKEISDLIDELHFESMFTRCVNKEDVCLFTIYNTELQ